MTNTHNVQTKKGFTMIELIFVIVIIGILAAVAIPRLAATRDDAKIATSLAELTNVVNEMSTHYTARGSYQTNGNGIETLTNTDLFTNAACTAAATEIVSGNSYNYCTETQGAGTFEPCVVFTPVDANGTLSLTQMAAPAGNVCIGMQGADAFIDLVTDGAGGTKVYTNGGSRVTF